jgi:hypothetical protein
VILDWLLRFVMDWADRAITWIESAWQAVPLPTDGIAWFAARCGDWVPVTDVVAILSLAVTLATFAGAVKAAKLVKEFLSL